MDGPDPGDRVRTAPPVARRRRRPLRWLIVVALAVLLGRGAGWIGGGTAATETAETGKLAARTPAPADAGPGATGPGAGATPAGAAPAAPAGEVAPAARSAVDEDRFATLVAMAETRSAERQFGAALAALEHLRGLPLDGPQRAVLARLDRQVAEALAAAGAAITEALERGEVLAAHDAAAPLLADHAERVGAALRQAGATFAAAGDVRAVPPRDGAMWPQPKALATDRLVRARLAGEVITGRVVDSRSDEVTLRVERDHGVTYPTVRVVHCEPLAATAAEAVEMGFAALHAGDGLLARLWLAAARSRGAEVASGRAARLAELLR